MERPVAWHTRRAAWGALGVGVITVAIYRRYPWSSVATYHAVTLLHFGLGAVGMVIAYDRWPALGWALAIVYAVVAFGQMYVMMPLAICPACPYRTMSGSRCVMAMNIVSARLRRPRPPADFARRAEGVLCHNNLYLGSLVAPVALLAIGIIVNFSLPTLVVLVSVVVLLAIRVVVVFRRLACPHCAAKGRCPNAKAMGLA
jgi:hypothetical protein